MTNAYSFLSTEQEAQLLGAYTALKSVAAECRVPAVGAAVAAALAELRTALDGQDVEIDYFSV
ncbi:DUF6052 family protein [Streptomyces viridosporus]|uniref:Predicted protein n=1 Tax=Streptomyces viridosporus (strain ATCC 14672 / DSM 40746 / JCM 4963 / KCTC 9882 / NRRL B-12104 / FH 1290) TaxID=566461 RepID=D6AAC6_STRV1|nr:MULTISPECIES: DUF6052 family protein [Streptomyces]EFE72461.1 predicted protein [Streptomyces viridosporus ATCC 14672]PWJ04796.1 hypothetical protein DKG34_25900 [Streptomyces sp. NWU49]